MAELNEYEKIQIKEIEKWKNEDPGVVSQTMGKAIEPLAWLLRKLVPDAAIRGALYFSNTMAEWLTDTKDVLRDGEVAKVSDLRKKSLELSDKLADSVHNCAIGIAASEGTATGIFGLPATAVDVPVVVTLALRTIHKIGICYGYESTNDTEKKFILGIMAASSANSQSEKVAAIATLRSIETTLAKVTWKKMAEKAAESQVSKEAAILSIKSLAKQLGVNITKRKALAAIPVVGAIIGGSVNAWFLKECGWAARRAFQERWLIENCKIESTRPS